MVLMREKINLPRKDKMTDENFNKEEEEIALNVILALKAHDEKILKFEILKLMKLFLNGKSDVYNIDRIASSYFTAKIHYKECRDYKISDPLLHDTYMELGTFEDYRDNETKARQIVEKLLKKLQDD
jgi:hypothetical protein